MNAFHGSLLYVHLPILLPFVFRFLINFTVLYFVLLHRPLSLGCPLFPVPIFTP